MQVLEPTLWEPRLVDPFAEAVREVLSTMASTPATTGVFRVKDGSEPRQDVSGIISFSGGVVGSVVIAMTTDIAVQLVGAFAGMIFPADSSDFADAVGELANMVAGSAKKNLGVLANITVPTVVIGKNHKTAVLSGVPCIVIPCTTKHGTFEVEVNIKET